jgi:hypothetical protein
MSEATPEDLTYRTPPTQGYVFSDPILDEGDFSQPQIPKSMQEITLLSSVYPVTPRTDGHRDSRALFRRENTSLSTAAKALLEVLTPPPTERDTEVVKEWVLRQRENVEVLAVSLLQSFS